MMLILIILICIIIYSLYSSSGLDQDIQKEDELLTCFNCGYEVKEDYNFCPKCKDKLKKSCDKCGKLININWRNCPYCDHPNFK